MEDSVPIQTVEITESEKNIKQIASIWGTMKSVGGWVIFLLNLFAPLAFMLSLTTFAVFAYSRTVGGTSMLPAHVVYTLKYSLIWTFGCIPIQRLVDLVLYSKEDKTVTVSKYFPWLSFFL